METLVETVEKDFEDTIKWREEQIMNLRRDLHTRVEIAKVIDETFGDDRPAIYTNSSSFEISFNSVDEARAFIGILLTKLGTELENFTKEMEGFSSKLEFYFKSYYRNIMIKVSPSEPIEGCIPVLKESTSSYWVCMKK